jgi:hypothetical protein
MVRCTYKVAPLRVSARGRGTERTNSRRAGNATNAQGVAPWLEAPPGSPDQRGATTMTTVTHIGALGHGRRAHLTDGMGWSVCGHQCDELAPIGDAELDEFDDDWCRNRRAWTRSGKSSKRGTRLRRR